MRGPDLWHAADGSTENRATPAFYAASKAAVRQRVAAMDSADDFARVLLRRAVAQVGRSHFRLGNLEAARASARRTLTLFDTSLPVDQPERQWRGWAQLILAADGPPRSGAACTRLRRAVANLHSSERSISDSRSYVARVLQSTHTACPFYSVRVCSDRARASRKSGSRAA